MRIEQLPALVNTDPALVRRGRYLSTTFMLEVGEVQYLVDVRQGKIVRIQKGPFVMESWTFAIRAPAQVWQRFWRKIPDPGYHDIFALLRKAKIRFEGDLQPMMANLLYIKLVLAAPRALAQS